MYKVVKYFTDLQDNDHEYNVGDTFPRKGKEVSEARLAELSSKDNKQGVVLIQKVEEEAPKKEASKKTAKKKETE